MSVFARLHAKTPGGTVSCTALVPYTNDVNASMANPSAPDLSHGGDVRAPLPPAPVAQKNGCPYLLNTLPIAQRSHPAQYET